MRGGNGQVLYIIDIAHAIQGSGQKTVKKEILPGFARGCEFIAEAVKFNAASQKVGLAMVREAAKRYSRLWLMTTNT
jgi:hypothetical protein